MIEGNKPMVYSEVYGILNSLGTMYTNAIPKRLFDIIEQKREKTYNPIYNMDIPLSNQKISKQATALICMLHYNYWCTSDEEKEKINEILAYNTKRNREKDFEYEKNFSKNKSSNNPRINIEHEKMESEDKYLVKKDKNTIINKILNLIKKIVLAKKRN